MTENKMGSDNFDSACFEGVSISVFFPCYNEEDNVANITNDATKVLEDIGADYEIIIVNDGSSDNTGLIADELAGADDRIRVIHHPANFGYGAALQSGFNAAGRELVFYTDGDGQFDIKELPGLLELIKECDIVSCYRINRRDNLIRKINGWCWTKLVCLLFGMKIRDIDCAFKLYKRRVFDNIRMSSSGALIDTEILARATGKGYKIKQIGIHHYPRAAGTQTGAKLSVIIRAFIELFKLYRQIRRDRKS